MRYRRRQKAFVIFLFLLLFLLLSVLFYSVLGTGDNKSNKIVSPLSGIMDLISESKLNKIVEKHFSKDEGDWAVYIKNLKTGESFGFNENKQFNSASLYKLWVLAVALEQINEGRLLETQVLSAEKEKLDERLGLITPTPEGSEETEAKEKEEEKEIEYVSMVAGEAIEKMITISDNYSALLVSNRVGSSNITNFLEEYNFDDSNYKSPPQTTASDIANYFEFLYKGDFIDKEASDEMIEILKRQTFDDRIPKYLPENIETAHKTGELFGNKHDAGIVFAPNGDYIIVVMSKTESEATAAEKIAEFSKEIYDYFQE